MEDFNPRDPNAVAHIHPLKFWTEYVTQEGTEELLGVDWVQWVRKGTGTGATTEDKIARVRKDHAKWAVLEPYYTSWKKNEEAPVKGYHLDAWPGVTKQQAKVLKERMIFSVEDLARSSESDINKLGLPGIRQLQGRARAFLEARESTAEVSNELAKVREQNEELRKDLDEALSMLKQMKSSNDDDDGPKRRGRPPKESAE